MSSSTDTDALPHYTTPEGEPGAPIIPESELYTGNHTGLGFCTCPVCGSDGKILLQVIRANHLEVLQRQLNEQEHHPRQRVSPPRTSGEKRTECFKIRAFIKVFMARKFLEQLKEKKLEKEKLEGSLEELEKEKLQQTGIQPNEGEPSNSEETTTGVNPEAEAEFEARKMEEMADERASRTVDAYMAIYYPDYSYNRTSVRDIFAPDGSLIKEAHKYRTKFKVMEIASLWQRVERFRERAMVEGSITAQEAQQVSDRVGDENKPNNTSPRPDHRWQNINYMDLNDDPNGFPGVLKEMGYVIWLTRRALSLEWKILPTQTRQDRNRDALEVLTKFYVTHLDEQADFMDCETIGRISLPEARRQYLDFLVEVWDERIHKRIQGIALGRLAEVNASGTSLQADIQTQPSTPESQLGDDRS
ncbi:hypothetical protein TWF730_000457 [Orbilia blumenaviensis]|uniref:Uncharacterized protein n=1 Tax=Orbilia blumenaviensis TaxID=1796055 RepID=A0AAV9VNU8_9PEZI